MGGRWVLGLCLLAGCAAPLPRPLVPGSAQASLAAVLHEQWAAQRRALPRTAAEVRRLLPCDVLVLAVETPQVPSVPLDADARAALREWVREGGALLLLGCAARVVFEAGIEPIAPDRHDVYRWGVSDATALGSYEYGLRRTGLEGALLAGLAAEPGRGDVFLLGGGELASVPSCQWEGAPPSRGEVLGLLSRTRDGEPADLSAAVLAAWREGEGTVLAYGSLPEPARAQPRIARNARAFLRNAVAWLAPEQARPRVVLCTDEPPAPPERSARPPLERRVAPAAIAVPHWGWQVTAAATPGSLLEDVLVPSWRAGASLLELSLADREHGYPFAWAVDDPIAMPAGYHARAAGAWTPAAVAALAREAHARGMLAQLALDPPLVPGGAQLEQLAAIKWLGRELFDPRLLGEGALDGLGLFDWFADRDGYTRQVLRAASPAAYLYEVAADLVRSQGVVPAMHGRFGRAPGLPPAGLSARWRGGAFLDRAAVALDCGSGGSYGDWLLQQVNDFARPREGTGAALWWVAGDSRSLAPETVAYVHGVSMNPLRAAVAARLWATGIDGYRAQVREEAAQVQSGFGAESPLPSHVPFLQNNHFRLHGSGGPLWFDPSGTASFDRERGPMREIATRFVQTRLRGARPDASRLERAAHDFVGDAPRAAGDYGAVVRVEGAGGGFPAMLAAGEVPRWPRRVEIAFEPQAGSYVLELRLRAVAGSGTLELRRDGELLRVWRFRAGTGSVTRELACDIARSGVRVLSLEVVDGGSVAVDVCRLVQRRDETGNTDLLAGESSLRELAGHRAEIEESSSASFFAERLRLITIADLPGFAIAGECDVAGRNLEVVRSFELRGYARVLPADGETAERMQQPFVLASGDRELPDLAVVPFALPRYHWFSFSPGEGLRLTARPRSNETFGVGFLFLRDVGREALPHLRAVFEDLLAPRVLELGDARAAAVASDLPIAWPRAVRVLGRGPWRVCERGAWQQRGGQSAGPGGDWLLLYQFPGDVVRVEPCEHRTGSRPGIGSLHALALRDSGPAAATVDVGDIGRFATPSLVLGDAFDRITLDGRSWCHASGRTVWLPRAPGSYTVAAVAGAPPTPRLERTAADVRECAFDDTTRTLRVLALAADGDPPDTVYTAWFSGGEPVRIDGGERIADDELSYAPAQRARAAAAGFLVRFRPGVLQIAFR
jgi:hypothetical protein